MKKEINPAVAIVVVVVIFIGVAAYYFQHMDSPQLQSIRRGSVKGAGGGAGGGAQKPQGAGGG
jgi:hypothetical protein